MNSVQKQPSRQPAKNMRPLMTALQGRGHVAYDDFKNCKDWVFSGTASRTV
jgi:hypothetical protein